MFEKTQDQQQALRLLTTKSKNILLFGGSRSGKTFILVYALLVRAVREPGSRHIILRFRANSVHQSVRLDTFAKVVKLAFPGLRFRENRSDGVVILPNRSEIWFGGLDNDERSDRILGKEFATIYFNECSEISYESVNTALTRLAQKTALANKAYFDCNPAGKSHWSYRLFVEKIDPVTRIPLPHPEQYQSMLMNPAGNRANLPSGYIEETLANLSERQRQRFLNGLWMEEMAGSLWTREMIHSGRVAQVPCELIRVVIGLDPAVTSGKESDETGIVAAGKGIDGHYYILGDFSLKGTPLEWARMAKRQYDHFRADRLVGEVNNGGDLIESVLRNVAPELSYRPVHASRGKIARAEPIAALYEQKKVHHTGSFPELEEQLCSYTPQNAHLQSPDRMDALVWALTELAEAGNSGFITA